LHVRASADIGVQKYISQTDYKKQNILAMLQKYTNISTEFESSSMQQL